MSLLYDKTRREEFRALPRLEPEGELPRGLSDALKDLDCCVTVAHEGQPLFWGYRHETGLGRTTLVRVWIEAAGAKNVLHVSTAPNIWREPPAGLAITGDGALIALGNAAASGVARVSRVEVGAGGKLVATHAIELGRCAHATAANLCDAEGRRVVAVLTQERDGTAARLYTLDESGGINWVARPVRLAHPSVPERGTEMLDLVASGGGGGGGPAVLVGARYRNKFGKRIIEMTLPRETRETGETAAATIDANSDSAAADPTSFSASAWFARFFSGGASATTSSGIVVEAPEVELPCSAPWPEYASHFTPCGEQTGIYALASAHYVLIVRRRVDETTGAIALTPLAKWSPSKPTYLPHNEPWWHQIHWLAWLAPDRLLVRWTVGPRAPCVPQTHVTALPVRFYHGAGLPASERGVTAPSAAAGVSASSIGGGAGAAASVASGAGAPLAPEVELSGLVYTAWGMRKRDPKSVASRLVYLRNDTSSTEPVGFQNMQWMGFYEDDAYDLDRVRHFTMAVSAGPYLHGTTRITNVAELMGHGSDPDPEGDFTLRGFITTTRLAFLKTYTATGHGVDYRGFISGTRATGEWRVHTSGKDYTGDFQIDLHALLVPLSGEADATT